MALELKETLVLPHLGEIEVKLRLDNNDGLFIGFLDAGVNNFTKLMDDYELFSAVLFEPADKQTLYRMVSILQEFLPAIIQSDKSIHFIHGELYYKPTPIEIAKLRCKNES